MFGADNHKQVVLAVGEDLSTDERVFHVLRAPVNLELTRVSIGVGSGYRSEGGTAIWSFANYGTAGSAAKSSGGSVLGPSDLSGSVWVDHQVHYATDFTEATLGKDEWLVAQYSPQAGNAGSALAPTIHVEYLLGGGFS